MATINPLATFNKLLDKSDFLFIVYFRGHWCPFCMAYLKTFSAMTSPISAQNGTPLIITAEPAEHLEATLQTTGYRDEAIVDPEHQISKELKKRHLVDVAITKKTGYHYGMAQPAVLVIRKGWVPLVSWAIVPNLMNLGGAKDRVDLDQVWEDVRKLLRGDIKKQRTHYSKTGVSSLLKQKMMS